MAFKTKVRSQKYKKASYAIGNVSKKDFSKIIKEFEKIGNVPYVKMIPKHEPTSSYIHLVRCIAECMMKSDYPNMKNCGRCKVRKHKEIKCNDNIVTFNVSEIFDSMNNMETTSLESKGNWEDQERGL